MDARRLYLPSICLCAVWGIILGFSMPFEAILPLHILVGCIAIIASVYDAHTHQLPDICTIGGALIALPGYGYLSGWDALAGAGIGFIAIKGSQIFCRRRHGHECVGSGDSLLMLSLGAMTGVYLLPAALIVSVAGAAAYMRVMSRTIAPMGPFLTFGTFGVVIFLT